MIVAAGYMIVAAVECRRCPFIYTQTPHSSLIGQFLRKFPR